MVFKKILTIVKITLVGLLCLALITIVFKDGVLFNASVWLKLVASISLITLAIISIIEKIYSIRRIN